MIAAQTGSVSAHRAIESASPMSGMHWLLMTSVLVEFVAMRVLSRIGPLLPDEPTWDSLFQLLQTVGLGALNLIILSAVAVLLAEYGRSVRRGDARTSLTAAVCALAAVLILLLSFLGMSATSMLAGSLALGVSIAILFALCVRNPRERSFHCFLLIIFLVLTSYYAAKGATGLGSGSRDSAALYFLAEALAVVAGLAVPLVFRPDWHSKTAVTCLLLLALWALVAWSRPWALATLVMWNTGFSLWLPAPLYAVGLGVFLYTVLALAQGDAPGRGTAMGLLLIVAAGLKLDYSPYALMALLGCFLIAVPVSGASLQPRRRDVSWSG